MTTHLAVDAQVPPLSTCRACNHARLTPCLSLNHQYVSSVFPSTLDYRLTMRRYPLDVVRCDGGCGLVQLAHSVDLEGIYDEYPYVTAINQSMTSALRDVADAARRLGVLQRGDVILDIGCNDGTLLANFRDDPFELVGIDRAQSIGRALKPADATLVRAPFSRDAYHSATHRPAALIFAIAMFYGLDRPVEFVREVAACLDEGGVFIVQMAYLPAMLRTNMYDNIVHEHRTYYGAQTLQRTVEQAGLELFDLEENDVYGGSFRAFIQHRGGPFPTSARCRRTLEAEQVDGLLGPDAYRAFDARGRHTRAALVELCRSLTARGKRVWVYGASTKGGALLQACDLGAADIVAAADANPAKWGKFIAGADIPIVSEDEMRRAEPDYLLALPYSFISSFVAREQALLGRGTRFIVPLPEISVIP